jgi:ubiquinone/menaquinone biosynthesis C-methylase UbiE
MRRKTGRPKSRRFSAEGDIIARLERPERLRQMPADRIVSRLSLKEGELIVDLGTGIGYFGLPMAEAGARVIGLDIEPKMLQVLVSRAREMRREAVHPVMGDILSLPLRDRSADRLFGACIYHEVENPRKLIDEAFRVLKPGGHLTIVDFQKRRTSFGPPVRDRKTPDQVIRAASPQFALRERHEAKVYYQLDFVKPSE